MFRAMKNGKPVKINIAENFAPILGSRDVVRDLDRVIRKTKKNLVNLDFAKVDFVSRSAAHELVLLKEKWARRLKGISFINTNRDVANMLRLVAASRVLPLRKSIKFEPEVVSIKSLTGV